MYKQYALIQNGEVVEYPVDPRTWNPETNEFNIHEYWEGGELDGKTYVFCHNFEPSFKYDETIIEKTPAFNPDKGIWCRQYDIVKVDDATLSERRNSHRSYGEQLVAGLLREFESMQPTISELSESEQEKWAEYRQALLNVNLQPEYPFVFSIPTRPDYENSLKIKVERV